MRANLPASSASNSQLLTVAKTPTVAARRRSTKSRASVPAISLDQPGRLRVAHMLALLAVSHASFYNGLKVGKYPKPDGNDGRPFWKTLTAKVFLEG